MSVFELEPEAQPRSKQPTRTWRPLLLRLHFYAGVLVAPFILVAAVTGALYAIAPTIEQFVYRDVIHVDQSGTALPIGDQVKAAVDANPGVTLAGLRPSETGSDSTRVYFTDPALGPDEQRAVFVNPYNAEILGSETTWFGYLPLSTWLDGLHRHLHLGEPGRLYSETAASWLWIVALGGLVLWIVRGRRNGKRLFTIDRRLRGRARTLNWHGAAGIWIVLGLLFLSATGLTWSTYAGAHIKELRTAMAWSRPSLDTTGGGHHANHEAASDVPVIDYDSLLAKARSEGVTVPLDVTLPSEPAGSVGIAEIDKSFRWSNDAVALDPGTETVTAKLDFGADYSFVAKLADWGIRLHMGFMFGIWNQIGLLILAGLLISVIVRGYVMWWRRRPTRGSTVALGRPPMRGTWRRLAPGWVAVVVVAAAGFGWFAPLFGWPLLAFLLFDLLVQGWKRRSANA